MIAQTITHQPTTNSKKGGTTMQSKQIILDLTISINRIKKVNYNRTHKYQNYIQETDTTQILNKHFTTEEKLQILKAYNIINNTKIKINKITQQEAKLQQAYGDKPHISELPTTTIEYIKKQQENKINPEKQPLPINKSKRQTKKEGNK